MSITLLRQILRSQLSVSVESTPEIVQSVEARIEQRRAEFVGKGKPVPDFKTPLVEAARAGTNDWLVRPIDLLHKLGRLTTPVSVNMSRLSASWATRRYFWAIAPAVAGNNRFRLSDDARDLDFHQKTLLSDEFGVAFAGLLMEEFYTADQFVDISIALADPDAYDGIRKAGRAAPDYLMWNSVPNSPFYVVECKGCQTNYSSSIDQLRRGMEQVPTIRFNQNGGREIRTLVIASLMEDDSTRILVLDPPPSDDEPGESKRFRRDETVSDKVKRREWLIKDPEKFSRRGQIADDVHLLRWSGQFRSAAARVEELGIERRAVEPVDLPIQERQIEGSQFQGVTVPAFPELGGRVRVFTGVREDILDAARTGQPELRHLGRGRRPANVGQDAATSLSSAGTCLLIEGVF